MEKLLFIPIKGTLLDGDILVKLLYIEANIIYMAQKLDLPECFLFPFGVSIHMDSIYRPLKYTTTLFSLFDHYILSREW